MLYLRQNNFYLALYSVCSLRSTSAQSNPLHSDGALLLRVGWRFSLWRLSFLLQWQIHLCPWRVNYCPSEFELHIASLYAICKLGLNSAYITTPLSICCFAPDAHPPSNFPLSLWDSLFPQCFTSSVDPFFTFFYYFRFIWRLCFRVSHCHIALSL